MNRSFSSSKVTLQIHYIHFSRSFVRSKLTYDKRKFADPQIDRICETVETTYKNTLWIRRSQFKKQNQTRTLKSIGKYEFCLKKI